MRIISAILLAPLLLAGCSRTTTEPIQVGHIAPESSGGKIGQHARRGITVAVDDIKDDALIHGRKVVVRHVDNKGSAEQAHADAVRLISLNRVIALLGDTDAAATAEIGQAARSYGVPVISSTS